MPKGGSGFTGANAVPLGPRNRAIGAKRSFSSTPPPSAPERPSFAPPPPSMLNPPLPPEPSNVGVSSKAAEALRAAQAAAASLRAKKFGDKFSVQPPPPPKMVETPQEERGRPKKKRSRWGAVDNKTEIPGIPSSMPANLTPEQQKAYIVQLQIEDLTRKLKSGNLGIAPNPEDRSPSPEPIYNNEGKRLNTREYRTRKRLEEDRHKLIQDMMKINENYKPPMDYKPPIQRISEQINIPSELNPSINFVGLLIGPRGNTLKKIEKECNCKIMIRGKGSVKEGKIGRKDGMPLPGEDEPLHALITGTRIEDVQKASKEINRIIKQGIEQPEGQNDLRKNQLMELARLNGTWREDNTPREREWLKPENQNITNTTVCTKCGGRGHLAQDCVSQAPSVGLQQQENAEVNMNQVDKAKMDSEYLSLMAELGEGPPPGSGGGGGNNSGGNNQQFGNRGGPGGQWGGSRGGYGGSQGGYGGQMGGNRAPWMRGGPRGGGGRGGNFGNRGGGGGNRGGYGNRQGDFQTNSYGGYASEYSNSGNQGTGNQGMGNQNMGNQNMGGNMGWGGQYDNSSGYGGMDNSGMGLMNPPPPPPPGNAPQPPPPPSSDDGSNSGGGWNQNNQWGNDGTQGGGNQGGGTGNNQGGGNDYSGSDYSGGQQNMGWGNMGWGMWGNNMGGGMAQPPMPPGPGPVAPPPPGGDDSNNTSGNDQSGNANQQWGWGNNNWGNNMGMGMPFGMPPAPPPPPPSS